MLGMPQMLPEKAGVTLGGSVTLRLATGETVTATVVPNQNPAESAKQVSTRTQIWSRWCGTPDDLISIVQRAVQQLETRAGLKAPLDIEILLGKQDLERFHDFPAFRRELLSSVQGAPGSRLREIKLVVVSVGPVDGRTARIQIRFSADAAPGVALSVEDEDRALASGLRDEMARVIDAGKPKMPAITQLPMMILGMIVGVLYYFLFDYVVWDYLPRGLLGVIFSIVLYGSGFIALIYALGSMSRLLPTFSLLAASGSPPSRVWKGRVMKVGGAVATAALAAIVPIVINAIFQK